MKKKLNDRLWEFLLCCLIGTGLSAIVFAGFELNDPWSGSLPLVAGIVTLLTAVFFLAACRKLSALICVLATAAVLFACALFLVQTALAAGVHAVDGSPLLFWTIVIAVAFGVFWLKRNRIGIVILFLFGTLIAANFDFLLYPVTFLNEVMFLFGTIALYLYCVYRASVHRSETGNRHSGGYFVQGVVVALVALLLAGGAYQGMIKPLSPPTKQSELAAKLMTIQLFKELGISTVTEATDSIDLNQQNQTKTEQNSQQDQTPQNQKGTVVQSKHSLGSITIRYLKPSNFLWIVLIALLLLPTAVVVKLFLRKRWYRRILKKEKEDGATLLYLFFLKDLQRAGYPRPKQMTLMEYADQLGEELQDFSVYDADFLRLTKIYQTILYGSQGISEEDYDLFLDFYHEFFRHMRSKLGKLKYSMNFFLL